MPLSIPLPAGAKIIVNGAVIENSGAANISLTIHNRANILRDKDVLTVAEATTPARQLYHAIQNAYLFESNRDEWLRIVGTLIFDFAGRGDAEREIVLHLKELIAQDKLYNALRATRKLIVLEDEKIAGREAGGASNR